MKNMLSAQEKAFLEMQQNIKDLTSTVQSIHDTVDPLSKVFDKEFIEKLVLLVAAADSVVMGRKLLAGMAVIVTSVAAIGSAAIWFFSHFRPH